MNSRTRNWVIFGDFNAFRRLDERLNSFSALKLQIPSIILFVILGFLILTWEVDVLLISVMMVAN